MRGAPFSNGLLLRVEARRFKTIWDLYEVSGDGDPEWSLCEPVELVWRPGLTSCLDPASLLGRISGAEFKDLFVNPLGLLLYTRGNPILWFTAMRDRESSVDLLIGSFTR